MTGPSRAQAQAARQAGAWLAWWVIGKGWIEDSAAAHADGWITVIFVASSILVCGAVLRVAGGVFWAWAIRRARSRRWPPRPRRRRARPRRVRIARR